GASEEGYGNVPPAGRNHTPWRWGTGHGARGNHACAANPAHLIGDTCRALLLRIGHFEGNFPLGTVLHRPWTEVREEVLRGQRTADFADQLGEPPPFTEDVIVTPAGLLGDLVQVRRGERSRRDGEHAQ